MQTKQDILDFCDSFNLPLKNDLQTLWDLGFVYTLARTFNQTTGTYYIRTCVLLDDSNDNFVELTIWTSQCKPTTYTARVIRNNHAVAEFSEHTLDKLLAKIIEN